MAIDGKYFFADNGAGQVWSFDFDTDNQTISNLIQWDIAFDGPSSSLFANIASVSFDGLGNLYFTNLFGSTFIVTAAELDAVAPAPAASLLMLCGLALLR